MNGRNSIWKDFEVFLTEYGIESMPQDIGPMECANQNVVAMAKRTLKVPKLKKLLRTKAVANATYTIN